MGLLRDLGRFVAACRFPDDLSTITLFITSRCDAHCDTFYWQSLNTQGDLTLDELRTFSNTTPPFNSLWLSGGEPMLRPDLSEVLHLFVRRNRVKMINLPSIGMHADRVAPLVDALLAEFFDLDGHFFQVIRGTAKDTELLDVPPERLAPIYRDIVPIQDHYARRFKVSTSAMKRRVGRMAYLGMLTFQHRIQQANYTSGRPWPMRCTAGATSLVIDHNGDVRACELREPIGNLRDFDFGRLWESGARRLEVERVRRDRCICTHICGIQDSIRHSRKAIFYHVPRAFLTRPRSTRAKTETNGSATARRPG